MSTKKYKGPIETIEHAMVAHMVVTIECTRCRNWTTRWAWKLYEALKKKGREQAPLKQPVGGFWCRGCRRRVSARIMPGMR